MTDTLKELTQVKQQLAVLEDRYTRLESVPHRVTTLESTVSGIRDDLIEIKSMHERMELKDDNHHEQLRALISDNHAKSQAKIADLQDRHRDDMAKMHGEYNGRIDVIEQGQNKIITWVKALIVATFLVAGIAKVWTSYVEPVIEYKIDSHHEAENTNHKGGAGSKDGT